MKFSSSPYVGVGDKGSVPNRYLGIYWVSSSDKELSTWLYDKTAAAKIKKIPTDSRMACLLVTVTFSPAYLA